MYDSIADLHALCHVVKLCYIRGMGLCNFRQTDSSGQVEFGLNDSNGTKWMLKTDINVCNLRMLAVTAINFDSFASQIKRLSMYGVLCGHDDVIK